jgi:hypothetical protein
MSSKKFNIKGKIEEMYLQDYYLIQLVLYFPTYLPTYVSKYVV